MPQQNILPIVLTKSVETDQASPIIHNYDSATDTQLMTPPGQLAANHIQQTGIQRNGGLTNIYQKKFAYTPSGIYYPTQDGHTISSTTGNIANTKNINLDGNQIGTVSKYGVQYRDEIIGVDDVIQEVSGNLETGYYLTASVEGNSITISRYDVTTQTLQSQRTTVFSVLSELTTSYTSLNFVRASTIGFGSNLQFVLRTGNIVYLLDEGNPTNPYDTFYGDSINGYTVSSMTSYSTFIIFGTVDGGIGSIDSNGFYKYPDGSGNGTGPYLGEGLVLGTGVEISKMTSYSTFLVVSGGTSLGSYDGTNWKYYDGTGTGTGPFANNTFGGTILEIAPYTYSATLFLYVSAGTGLISSYDGTNWKYYNGSGTGTGAYDNGTLLGGEQVLTMIPYTNATSSYLVFGGASGRIASLNNLTFTLYNAGSGLSDNGTVVSTDTITAGTTFTYSTVNYLLIGSSLGKVASWDGSAWKKYDGTGTGTGPYNNATVVGANNISSITSFDSKAVVLGEDGISSWIGYWDGLTWYDYTTQNSTLLQNSSYFNLSFGYGTKLIPYGNYLFFGVGTNNIYCYHSVYSLWETFNTIYAPPQSYLALSSTLKQVQYIFNGRLKNYIIIYNASGFIASFDGLAWKNGNGDGTGTGPYNPNGYPIPFGDSHSSLVNMGGFVTSTNSFLIVSADIYWLSYSSASTPNNQYKTDFISSWDENSGTWKYYNGTGTGTGPYKSTNSFQITWINTTGAQSVQIRGYPAIMKQIGNNFMIFYSFYLVGYVWMGGQSTYPSGTNYLHFTTNNGNELIIQSSAFTVDDTNNWTKTSIGVFPNYPLEVNTHVSAGQVDYNENWTDAIEYNSGIAISGNKGDICYVPSLTLPSTFSTPSVYGYLSGFGPTKNGSAIFGARNTIFKLLLYNKNSSETVLVALVGPTRMMLYYNYVIDFDLRTLIPSPGLIAYFSGGWYPYNTTGAGTTSISNNQTAIGANNFGDATTINNVLIVTDTYGKIASYDGFAWKNYDGTGTGTGVYRNLETLLTTNFTFDYLINYGSAVYFYNRDNTFSPFYTKNGLYFTDVKIINGKFSIIDIEANQIFAYLFENGTYLFGITGNSSQTFYFFDTFTTTLSTLTGVKYALIQFSNGYSRAILTGSIQTGTSATGFGIIGYNTFNSTFTNTVTYPTSVGTIAAVNSPISAPGYTEANIKIGTNTYQMWAADYAPEQSSGSATFKTSQNYSTSQPTLFQPIAGYTKLTNNINQLDTAGSLVPSVPFEFRIGLQILATTTSTTDYSAVWSFLSVAAIDGNSTTEDTVGALITNVGEIDQSYIPQIAGDKNILYKWSDKFYIITISDTPTKAIRQVSQNLYKINTISPNNLVYTKSGQLYVSSADYNGRMKLIGTSAPTSIASEIEANYQQIVSNSIDTGSRFLFVANPTSSNFKLLGYRIPYIYSIIKNYEIDVYIYNEAASAPSNVYYTSVQSDGSYLVQIDKNGVLYTQLSFNPMAIGYDYQNYTLQTFDATYFIAQNFSAAFGYGLQPFADLNFIGNKTNIRYDSFFLYGQSYLYDGVYVYVANFNNSIYQNNTIFALATGLKYIASSPTTIFFASSFDNSLYTFTGNREITKTQRFNKFVEQDETDIIIDGVYSTRDNTLLLQLNKKWIWVRDGVISVNPKDTDQIGTQNLYTTINGIVINNETTEWDYSYIPMVGSTPVPFTWQSAFLGAGQNMRSNVNEYAIYLYDPTRSAKKVTVTYNSFDSSNSSNTTDNVKSNGVITTGETLYTENVEYYITPASYLQNGRVSIRFIPRQQKCLASSITISSNDKIQISEAYLKYSIISEEKISPAKTR